MKRYGGKMHITEWSVVLKIILKNYEHGFLEKDKILVTIKEQWSPGNTKGAGIIRNGKESLFKRG